MVPQATENDFREAYTIFVNNLPACPNCLESETIVIITINVTQDDRKPELTTNENYNLEVNGGNQNISINISAATYFGARHALETVLQLIWYDRIDHTLKIFHDLIIQDSPVFSHRGLMIDTARNYIPTNILRKAVDGLAASKMNVLHLHLTDATSFSIILPNNPGFAEVGAYGDHKVHKPDDIKGIIKSKLTY